MFSFACEVTKIEACVINIPENENEKLEFNGSLLATMVSTLKLRTFLFRDDESIAFCCKLSSGSLTS